MNKIKYKRKKIKERLYLVIEDTIDILWGKKTQFFIERIALLI